MTNNNKNNDAKQPNKEEQTNKQAKKTNLEVNRK